jgi:DNA-3-methyladenine glycosylase
MIERDFFKRAPLVCARQLIGAELCWGDCSGIIVETEAYAAVGDAASHTFSRPSARAFVAAHPPGTAYVYLNYGMHWLFNVLVKGRRGDGFVLVRALEPGRGIAEMAARRRLDDVRKLCAGPGRLTQALGIDGAWHGRDLCADAGYAFAARLGRPRLVADGRIGISVAADLPWRFTLAGSAYVSVKPRQAGAREK